MERIELGPDGSISGYKTNFMKSLVPEIANDSDRVFVQKPHKLSTIAACSDILGHRCEVCLEIKNNFVEIKSPFILSNKICDGCIELMHEGIKNIKE
jgi:hypothetical protein